MVQDPVDPIEEKNQNKGNMQERFVEIGCNENLNGQGNRQLALQDKRSQDIFTSLHIFVASDK